MKRWRKLTPEQEAKWNKFQENLRTGKAKITIAPRKKVKSLQPYLDIILKAVGHPEALVTDESRLGDFAVTKRTLNKIKKLGIKCTESSYLFEMAKQLRDLEQ